MQNDTNGFWPDGQVAAVSLTFDDGLQSQLDLAVPILGESGVLGTFYVNPQDGYEEDLLPWQEVAAMGHEIGNHTVQVAGHLIYDRIAFRMNRTCIKRILTVPYP